MYINTNKKELQELARYFYNITNTLISIYDEQENLICSYPDNLCAFCTEVRKKPELAEKCHSNDKTAFQYCKQTHSTYTYHCHMGLLEVATPIVYNNIILGYMLFGQLTDEKDKTALMTHLESVIRAYHLTPDILTSEIQNIKYRSEEYIQSISKLLEMCASYIWLNSIISIRHEGLAFSLDLFIKEHISEKLSISRLCKEFAIGRSTLYEISVNNFGCSITEYIQNYRNEYAKELLKEERRISEVAEAVGFQDTNYFIRFFKKRNLCTPKAYQKML